MQWQVSHPVGKAMLFIPGTFQNGVKAPEKGPMTAYENMKVWRTTFSISFDFLSWLWLPVIEAGGMSGPSPLFSLLQLDIGQRSRNGLMAS